MTKLAQSTSASQSVVPVHIEENQIESIELDKYGRLNQMMKNKSDYDVEDFLHVFGIPVTDRNTIDKDEQLLKGFNVVLIESKDYRGNFYFTKRKRLLEDLHMKTTNQLTSRAALIEKEEAEAILVWKWGATHLRKFVLDLGGKFTTIQEKTMFKKTPPSNLIFILGPNCKKDIPIAYIALGSTLHRSVERFISVTINELDQIREAKKPSPNTTVNSEDISGDINDLTGSDKQLESGKGRTIIQDGEEKQIKLSGNDMVNKDTSIEVSGTAAISGVVINKEEGGVKDKSPTKEAKRVLSDGSRKDAEQKRDSKKERINGEERLEDGP